MSAEQSSNTPDRIRSLPDSVWNFIVPRNDSLTRILLRVPVDGTATGLAAV